MARKVFISFLGTNNYIETYYVFDGRRSTQPMRFIQEALISNLCQHWTAEDEIVIFCTKVSQECNWLDREQEGVNIEGLHSRIKQLHLPVHIDMVEIPEGFSEEEIWGIFDKVYNKLQKDDNIYFDVTHSFRSIPMFSTILFNYAHYLKQTNLVGVYYGAFEKLGFAAEVRKMPIEKRVAPIIDLTSIVKLQELTSAANNFHQFGKMSSLSDLLKIMQSKGKEKQDIDRVTKKMKEFDLAISTCKLDVIKQGKSIGELQELVESVKKMILLSSAHQELIAKVENDISVFKPCDTYENVEASIDWARKYGMIQQAYTLAEELTISKVKDRLIPQYDLLQQMGERDCRVFVSVLLSLDINKEEYHSESSEVVTLFYELFHLPIIEALRPHYRKLSGDRNIINHAKKNDKDLVVQFDKNYNKIREILSHVH